MARRLAISRRQACAGCAGKTEGTCMQDNNNVCYAYNAGTHTCPAGSSDCKAAKKSQPAKFPVKAK